MDVNEIQKAYEGAWSGHADPAIIAIQCSVCRKSFVLTKGNPNNRICEHLQKMLDDSRKEAA